MEQIWQNTLIPDISADLQAWLTHSGSFMERLRSKNIHNAAVSVLSESWSSPELWETDCLGQCLSDALIREVIIASGEQYWMYARTVIPRETLVGDLSELAHLKNRPLGSVLFNHPLMQRGAFDFIHLQPGMDWHAKVMSYVKRELPALWSRRSIFSIQNKSILLTEVFLPDIVTV